MNNENLFLTVLKAAKSKFMTVADSVPNESSLWLSFLPCLLWQKREGVFVPFIEALIPLMRVFSS